MDGPTPIESLRASASKTITSPITGNTYRVRKIGHIEFNRARIAPILPAADTQAETAASLEETPFLLRVLDSTQSVLESGAGIFFGLESETPEGRIHSSWIAGDEGWLSDEILKFSGLDIESQKKLDDLLKNRNGSEQSIPFAALTADSQAS